jgi:AcrR family transcriptional regulator
MSPAIPIHPSIARPEERSDAARNRRRVLEVAERLFAERGDAVTMDEIAREAGVGTGTVYRRFGDRAGLAQALLDTRERELQAEILRGPAPLGPGAPARERLHAFLHALVDRNERHLELLAIASAGEIAHANSVYAAVHMHIVVLLRELAPDGDHALLADLLVAPLAPPIYRHLRTVRQASVDEIKEALCRLVDGLAAPAPSSPAPSR